MLLPGGENIKHSAEHIMFDTLLSWLHVRSRCTRWEVQGLATEGWIWWFLHFLEDKLRREIYATYVIICDILGAWLKNSVLRVSHHKSWGFDDTCRHLYWSLLKRVCSVWCLQKSIPVKMDEAFVRENSVCHSLNRQRTEHYEFCLYSR